MICYAIGICCCFALRAYLIWMNKKRDHLSGGSAGGIDGGQATSAFVDKTDKEEPSFRYVF